jgi:hypothetical protein
MRTRSRAQIEAAAHILVQLSQSTHAFHTAVMETAIEVQPVQAALEPEVVQPVLNALPCSPNASPHASPIRAPQQAHHRLPRSLSHTEEARARADAIAPQTQPGDTILMNFFINRNGYTTLQYMKNENDTMVVHTIEGPQDILTIPWTFIVTDFAI